MDLETLEKLWPASPGVHWEARGPCVHTNDGGFDLFRLPRGREKAKLIVALHNAWPTLRSELTRLRSRLEIGEGPDGIECRDETIRMQDQQIARLREDAKRYRIARQVGDWSYNMKHAKTPEDFDAACDSKER